MFIYYSSTQARNRDFRGPDFFAVLDVDGTRERQGWVVWEEEGRYPDVIVELMSSSTAEVDRGKKKDIYERIFRTRDYFVFNPFDPNSLAGWQLDPSLSYRPLVQNEQGWLWCQTLGFWLGTWLGTIDRETAVWLRFYDEAGNLVPLPEEAAEQQGLEQGLQQGLEQGLQQGLQQGLEQGLQQGQQQGASRQLLRLLTTRFGSVPGEVEQGLQALDLNQLEDLVEAALEASSLEEFVQGMKM
jgi:hypothetical protein